MRNRIKYSQNFIKDINLITKLVNKSSIDKNDIVVEIGAGEGIITSVLSNYAKSVVAYEIDENYVKKLSSKFNNTPNVELRHENFLNADLPNIPYKVFSNIPFNMTADIMKKLFLTNDPPSDSFLILQIEAAMRFIGKPVNVKNSLQAVLIYPWFEIEIIHEFNSNDFFPKPNVKIVLINVKKRNPSLIMSAKKQNYYDFIAYTYTQHKPKLPGNATQSELGLNEWIKLFKENKNQVIKGSYKKLIRQQENIEKIHRTRVDKSWRDFDK